MIPEKFKIENLEKALTEAKNDIAEVQKEIQNRGFFDEVEDYYKDTEASLKETIPELEYLLKITKFYVMRSKTND